MSTFLNNIGPCLEPTLCFISSTMFWCIILWISVLILSAQFPLFYLFCPSSPTSQYESSEYWLKRIVKFPSHHSFNNLVQILMLYIHTLSPRKSPWIYGYLDTCHTWSKGREWRWHWLPTAPSGTWFQFVPLVVGLHWSPG